MPKGSSNPTKARRTANACVACRESKIKCSGEEPCANCQRRLIACQFGDSQHNVVVSRRYLQDLRKRAERGSTVFASSPPDGYQPLTPARPTRASLDTAAAVQPSQISPPDSSIHATVETHHENECAGPSSSSYPPLEPIQFHTDGRAGMTVWTNPFAFPSKTIRNPDENNRKWIWLAPWSTWSFTVRLTVTLMRVLGRDATDMASASATGVIYPMTWKQVPEDEPPDISGLPSIDHALYLFNTAKFHLGQQYRFFQDGSFEAQIHTFYRGDARAQAATSRIWFVQFLVVLAFGSAFLSKAQQPGEAPGSKYFVRAMSLLPPTASIWKGSLLACETLALVGLYFYSTNHRETALLYVGQALRIAQLEGIHTQLPEDELGRETVQRCRSLWCTIWIMDRHISTSLGLSMSTADCDFSGITGEPAIEKEEDTVLILQAKLSQLNWEILQTLYRGDRSPISVFLEKTRFILQTLAGHAQEIEQIITLKFGNSLETMPKGTRHITLLYHQCVIVATRPLLYSVLKERLDKLNGSNDGPNNFENFLALATTLISTGIKSAAKTLHILSREDTLLASFLPFDLEFTYGAALHLTMARALFPGPEEDATEMKLAKTILKEMISKGSDLAEARKKDLIRLEQLCADFTQKSEQQGMQALILPVPEISNSDQGRDSTGQSQVDGFVPPLRSHLPAEAAAIPPDFSEYSPETALHHQYMMENSAFLDDIGISSNAFYLIADQMAEMGGADFPMADLAGFMAGAPHGMQ